MKLKNHKNIPNLDIHNTPSSDLDRGGFKENEKYSTLIIKTQIIESRMEFLSSCFDKISDSLSHISSALVKVTTQVDMIKSNLDDLVDKVAHLEIKLENNISKSNHLEKFTASLDVRINQLESKEHQRQLKENKKEGSHATLKQIPRMLSYAGCAIFGVLSMIIAYEQFKVDSSQLSFSEAEAADNKGDNK